MSQPDPQVLVAASDVQLALLIQHGLGACKVDIASDANRLANLTEDPKHSLFIVDADLPGIGGLEFVKRMRERRSAGIIIMSSHADIPDRIRWLASGADEYLLKPFDFRELAVRVKALLGRDGRTSSPVLQLADLRIDRVDRIVTRASRIIALTPKEFGLLEYLALNAGFAVTRGMILDHVWDLTFDSLTNIVDVYINYLRRKIDDGQPLKLIRTVRGVGYSIDDSRAEAHAAGR